MISRAKFNRVLTYIRDAGVSDYVEDILRPAHAGGRPRQMEFSVLLAGIIIASEESKKLALSEVHRLLTEDLPNSYQRSLGILSRQPDGSFRALTLRQVRYMFEAIEKKLAHTVGSAPDLSEEERQKRRKSLQRIMDLLLDGTNPVHLPPPTSYALDATAIDSWAKPGGKIDLHPEADHITDSAPGAPRHKKSGKRSTRRSFDRDAAHGYRSKTYDNRTNHCFGYHAFALVGVLPVGADPSTRPKLIDRLVLAPANASAIHPALTMIDSLRANERPIEELLSDREFSYKKSEDWARPLRERGISQVMDVHDVDRGIRDYNGIAMIDGTPHCRAVLGDREDLIRIPKPPTLSVGPLKGSDSDEGSLERKELQEEVDRFTELMNERSVAAFRRVAGPNADGDERWECPAQAGKVICANCPLSLDFPHGTPVVAEPHNVPPLPEPPSRPGKTASASEKDAYKQLKAEWDAEADFLRCCRQRTVTIPGSVSEKLRQKLPWGSKDWIRSYARRTHVEGAFGNLKSDKTTGVKRGWIYVVGHVKTSFMLSAAAVANNIRLLRKWADETGDRTHPLCARDPEYHGFEEIDVHGNPARANPPPMAC